MTLRVSRGKHLGHDDRDDSISVILRTLPLDLNRVIPRLRREHLARKEGVPKEVGQPTGLS